KWADWFPTPGEVPDAFGKSMSESIASLYGTKAVGLPAFDDEFKKIDPAPPPLSPALIRESVDYFRTIIEIERVWTLADWMGATAAMFFPLAFAYFGALALPLGKDLARPLTAADGPDAEDVRRYEHLVYPVAVSSLGPLVTMIIVSASGRGLRAEGVTGWIQAGLSLVASVGFFASLGGAGAARWTLWFGIPLGLAVAQAIFVAVRGTRENSRKLLLLGPIVQVLLALFFMLLYDKWLHEGVEELQKDSDKRDNGKAFGYFAAWLGIVGLLWFGTAALYRYLISSSVKDDQNEFLNGEPRQFLRLYDDTALVHDLAAPFGSDRLTDLSYPPARHALLKMWWTPGTAATLTIRILRDQLVFRFPGGVPDQVVFAPIAPITVEKFGQLLAKAVTLDAVKGTLNVAPFRVDEKGLELSPGFVFSDNGDEKTKLADYTTGEAIFRDVLAVESSAFVLFHTPRPRLAVSMGRGGVAQDVIRKDVPSKAGCLIELLAGTTRTYRSKNATDGTSPFLRSLFRPGDVIEIATGGPTGNQRIVEQVVDDTDIIVSSPFNIAIPAGGIVFKRAARDRGAVIAGISQLQALTPQAGVLPTDVEAVATPTFLGAQLKVGDTIEIQTVPPQRRTVVAIKERVAITNPAKTTSILTLDAVLAPVPAAGTSVAFNLLSDMESDGFPYIADADDVFGDSVSVMNDAADLAALLCVGAASRMSLNETPVKPDGGTVPFHRVTQVFRNWNLDRRRVNEWKMMVSGGAESERRGDFRASEEAAPPDRADAGEVFTDDYITKRTAGEATVRDLGWLGVFRAWAEVASHPTADTTSDTVFRPGTPSNRDLTRAMAYLLDAAPAAVP
ncbi:MAG: hypothetical protein ABI969_17790, partial [bacterium]